MQYTSSAYHRFARRIGKNFLLCLLLTPGFALAGLDVTPSDPGPFPDTRVGVTSSALTVTVTNNSSSTAVDITGVSISGLNDGDFAIDADNCSGAAPLASSGGQCTVDVTFSPTAAGARTASLDFTSSPDAGVPSATLNGIGTEPAVSLDRSSPLDLGSRNVGATSTAETVILTNTGTADLTVGTLAKSGTHESDYTLGGDNCSSAVLTPTSTCTFQVSLTPSAGGTRTAQVDIPSDAPTSPDVLLLTGIGIVVGPAVDLTPTSINFGGNDVGVPSSATQVTLENTGNQTLNVGALGVSGANLGDFAIGNDNCSSQAIDAGNTCTFDVTFTAGAQGARTAQVDIPSDAPTTPDTLPLSGNGLGLGASVDPTSINFGTQPVDVASAPETVTFSNTGTLGIDVGTVSVSGGAKGAVFALSSDSCSGQTVAGGNDCTFDVIFTPSSPGASSGQVSIPSNAPGAPHVVALSGTGFAGDDDFLIGAGMSGSFFDPAFAGQGLNIEIIAGQAQAADGKGGIPGLAVVYWYSFGPDGYPLFAFGVGNVLGNRIAVNMLIDYSGNGPVFGPGWQTSDFQPGLFAGATITALGCDALLFEFESENPGSFPSHPMDMERITEVSGALCTESKGNFVQRREESQRHLKGNLFTAAARSGSFYDPVYSGQGLNIEVIRVQNDGGPIEGDVVIYWYSFDLRGFPFFAFAVGSFEDDIMTARMLVDYDGNGPFFGPGWDPNDFTPMPFADIRLDWNGCESAVMTFNMLAPFSGSFIEHQMRLERITLLLNVGC